MTTARSRALILGNPLDHEGGMVAFNKGLIEFINGHQDEISLVPVVIGSRMHLFYYPIIRKLLYPFYYTYDLLKILVKLVSDKNIRILQLNPSLILVPIIRDSLVGFIAKDLFRKEVVIVIHGWKDYFYDKISRNRLIGNFVLTLLKKCDIIYVLAEEFKKKLIVLGIEERKIKITTTFFFKSQIVKQLPQKDQLQLIRFCYLGRISKLKGMDELISSLITFNKYHKDYICILVGHEDRPGVLEEYKKQISFHGLSDKILFLGRIIGPEKYEILSKSDIFILPSYTEGCPTSVIEALATGLFTIATQVGALEEIINERNGIKINPGKSDELLNAMCEVTKRINEIRSLRTNISADAHQKYEIEVVAKDFMQTYKDLLAN